MGNTSNNNTKTPKHITKKARLVGMLQAKGGATIAKLSDELGWQQHTTRAALTGLRKAGFEVAVCKPDRGEVRRYRIHKTTAASK